MHLLNPTTGMWSLRYSSWWWSSKHKRCDVVVLEWHAFAMISGARLRHVIESSQNAWRAGIALISFQCPAASELQGLHISTERSWIYKKIEASFCKVCCEHIYLTSKCFPLPCLSWWSSSHFQLDPSFPFWRFCWNLSLNGSWSDESCSRGSFQSNGNTHSLCEASQKSFPSLSLEPRFMNETTGLRSGTEVSSRMR